MDLEKYKNYKVKILDKLNNNKEGIFSKVIFVGDCKVGKSSIVKKLTKNIFSLEYTPTSGYDFYTNIIKIEDICIRFQIWDMCGKENYRSALFNLYRNASLGILVYSINDYKSFKNLDDWISQMKENGATNSKIILLGNKADDEENREVSFNEGKQICQKYNLELFMEVSAKNGLNSPNFLEIAAIHLYEEYMLQGDKTTSTMNNNESVNLSQAFENQKEVKCCL